MESIISLTECTHTDHLSVKYFRYFALLAQEMDIRIDEAFLVQCLHMLEIYSDFNQQHAKKKEKMYDLC